MRRFLIRCYPARWRARYGDEFEAILEERPLGPFDVADIVLGALDARLRMRGRAAGTAHGRGLDMSLRIGGIAAIVGATVFVIAQFSAIGLLADATLVVSLTLVGLAILLVALAGLSAFQARTQSRLSWAAFLIPAVGTVAIIVSVLAQRVLDTDGDGSFTGDSVVQVALVTGGLTALVGSALFGIATYRAGVLSRGGALLLVVAPVIALTAFMAALAISSWDLMISLFGLSILAFICGWYWLGIQALRQYRPSTEPDLGDRGW